MHHLISFLEIGDRVLDQDGREGNIISISDSSIEIRKSDMITSHSLINNLPNIKKILPLLQTSLPLTRGGSRIGAGRPPSGKKLRKAIQLDISLASKLPDLKLLSQLLDQFRATAESGTLRSQKLSDFYKELDKLPRIS